MKLEFPGQIFEKNTQLPNFMKIRPVGVEMFHADGQTDMTKFNSRLSQICKRDYKWMLKK